MKRRQHAVNKEERAAQTALMLAAGVSPNTFQKSLMPRDAVDQGVVTGVTMAVDYGLASVIRKTIEDVADQLAGTENAKDDDYKAHQRQRRFLIALDALLIGATTVAEKKFKADETKKDTTKDVIRTGNTWLRYAAIAGLATSLLQEGVEAASKPTDQAGNRKQTRLPIGVIAGTIMALGSSFKVRNILKSADAKATNTKTLNAKETAESMTIGITVMAVLGMLSYGQRKVADVAADEMEKVLPGSKDFWWSAGHLAAVVGTGALIANQMRRVYRKVEEVATKIEPAYLRAPASTKVSGSKPSLVKWGTLSVQGRRFAGGAITPTQIKTTLGEAKATEPIRVFVGLDSAKTEEKRVQLALAELERTKAYERDTIMLISPTGTGYVNYVAVESAEIMSRGNIASVALQYSKRPSPMSLDRVPEGRKQFKMILKAIGQRIASLPPAKRPRLVIFGESLGAWTSQDVFVEQGTDGLMYAGVDRALWIGSPYGSKWKTQVLGEPRSDVDKDIVASFDNFAEVKALTPAARRKLKYVMISHYNDAVTLFGASILFRKPDWLTDPAKRPPTIPKTQYYTSPGTFLLTLLDMKNSMNVIPGKFEANGHDYRADLAEFVAEVYGYKLTAKQMAATEAFLRQNELNRAKKQNPKL